MNYVPLVPTDPPLLGAVELIFSLDGYSPEHRVERLVPHGRVNLVIELDGRDRFIYDDSGQVKQTCRGAWLSGVHSRYLSIGETGPDTRLAAVQFAPGRALALIHQPLSLLNDRVIPASELFGDSINDLRERLVTTEPGAPTCGAIAAWLRERFDKDRRPPDVVVAAVDALLGDPGMVHLTRFVEEHGGASYKHFVELFKTHVGPTPKLFQRILRFAQVFERLQAQGASVDWARLSVELGYSDQAHFIRDFRAFSGYRPSDFLGQGHDRVNFFPDDGEPPADGPPAGT